MLHATRLMLTALAVGLLGFNLVDAQPKAPARRVQDDLSWFSKEARDKANADIARIKRDFRKDLAIETMKAPERPKELNLKDPKAVSRFFDEWAISRFKNERVDGVMILLVDEPRIVRVLVGPETEKSLFPSRNRDTLKEKIIFHLKGEERNAGKKEGDKDAALTAATSYVVEVMQEHRKTSVAAPQAKQEIQGQPVGHEAQEGRQVDWMRWVWIGLGVLIVFWLIRALLRAFSGGGAGGPAYGGGPGYGGPAYGGGPGYGGYGGGGGFFSNMLGGLFGAAAGMWMYNNVFGGHSSSGFGGAGGGAVGGATGAASAEPTDVGGGDPSVSGGDYGNDPAGGGAADAGGGDWNDAGDMGGGGGGDWGGGGGDVGGGGDWGGGGGGDWGGGGGGDW
ncbi:MAG: TPM domain-containing protein [Gemmataceae bacterium]|nr:TPM domain-containing protein [Gemmataceae bacterium]